jgi:hypothetical protein
LLKARLSQNFSFWESNLRLRGKAAFKTLFPELFPKLTEFWEKLRLLKFWNSPLNLQEKADFGPFFPGACEKTIEFLDNLKGPYNHR